jgi:hypothetical protein
VKKFWETFDRVKHPIWLWALGLTLVGPCGTKLDCSRSP